ncbi:unnamed protein product, partial [Ectocarpus sp. 4 AP-2014]
GPGQAAGAAAAAGAASVPSPTVPTATAEPSGAPASNGSPAATGGARKPSVSSPSPPLLPPAVEKPTSRELLELENTSPRGSSMFKNETGGGGGGGGQSVRSTSTLLWKVEWVFC